MGENAEVHFTARTLDNRLRGNLHAQEDAPISFSGLPIETPLELKVNRRQGERALEDGTAAKKPKEGSDEEPEEKQKKRGFFGFLHRKTEQLVDFLDERLLPIMEKPITRITVGVIMLGVGIAVLVTPIPGGVVLVPISLGVIFGVGPRRSWNAIKGFWKLTVGVWHRFFPKRKKKEEKNITANA